MALRKFDLAYDSRTFQWRLLADGETAATRVFQTKGDALNRLGGILAVTGGSVRIRRADGSIEEERSFPRMTGHRRPR